MSKGPQFERIDCRLYSQWWSKRGDDDLFWRTHGSGARATVRTKKGKKTRGQYGDMAATDSRGRTLTKCFTFSFKRGYSKNTLQDMLDSLENPRKDGSIPEQQYSGWIREARQACIDANSLTWMINLRRDRRKCFCILPISFLFLLKPYERKAFDKIRPQVWMMVWVYPKPPLTAKDKKKIIKERGKKKGKKFIRKFNKRNNRKRFWVSVIGIRQENLLEFLDRKMVCSMVKRHG